MARKYVIEKSEAADAFGQLMQDQDYRKMLFPVFHLDREQVVSISLSDVYGVAEDLNLTKEQRSALLDAYEKDVLEADTDTLVNSTPVGELSIGLSNHIQDTSPWPYIADTAYSGTTVSTVQVPQFYLYPEYDNTLELLRKLGCTLRTEILPEDVASICLSFSSESMETGKYSELLSGLADSAVITEYDDDSADVTVTDKDDISMILECTESCSTGILDDGSSSPDYLDIRYSNGESFGYSFQ